MPNLTGIDKLDEALENALPKGYTVLVQGSPGSGIELFAKQFAASGQGGDNVVYITSAETDEEINQTMSDYDWSTDMRIVNIGTEYYETVLSKELHISRYRQEGIKISDVVDFKSTGGIQKDINFLTKLQYEVVKTKPPFRIVIDSLDFFFQHYDQSKVLSTLLTLKAHAQHYESVVLVTMMKDVYQRKTQSVVEGIVDLILDLETKGSQDGTDHTLRITRVRNHPEKVGEYKFRITDKGISIE